MPTRHFILLLILTLVFPACSARKPSSAGIASHGETQLAYRTAGKGDPLIMIMGFGGTMDIWSPALIDRLSEHYRVVTFDHSGLGLSESGRQASSIKGMADDCMALIRYLGLAKPHVLGWSMGGLVAQELVIAHPDETGKLILLGTACDAGPIGSITKKLLKMSTEELLGHFFPPAWTTQNPDAFSRLPQPNIPAQPDSVQMQAEAMVNWPGSCDRIKQMDKQTLVMVGNQDDILPTELSLELTAAIRGAWLVRFNNAKHWFQYQHPERIAAIIHAFLKTEADMLKQQKTPAR